jgi:spoIIIJ-associated protein
MSREKIQTHISELLTKLGFEEKDVAVSHDEKSNTVWFAITSPHTRLLFNRDAEALLALNHLATKMAESIAREDDKRPRVIIDANDFEKKKIDNLRGIAHMMAERARYFKASVDVDPMPAHERRIVHEFLSEMTDITTESKGDGDKRHIVIKYTGGI